MNWSAQQETALARSNRWIQVRDKPYFMLAGYAGTGKTTLAKHLAANVTGQVFFASFTGKAAHVLMKSGIPDASTIHKLIYLPMDKCREKLATLKAKHKRLLEMSPRPTKEISKVEKRSPPSKTISAVPTST